MGSLLLTRNETTNKITDYNWWKCSKESKVIPSAGTVSYTHLDVYKRQVYVDSTSKQLQLYEGWRQQSEGALSYIASQ